MEILAVLLFAGLPAAILALVRRVAAARAVGPIVLCYAAGLLIGLSGLLPEPAAAMRGTVSEVSLGLALPLLLFSVDMRAWRRVAGRALLSMLLAAVAVVAVAVLLFVLFDARGTDRAEQLAAMAVGMYTGGIANMGAIKLALGIPDERYLLFATVDTVVGSVYLLFVLTVARRLFARVLPSPPAAAETDGGGGGDAPAEPDAAMLRPRAWPALAGALLAAGACVGLAVALAPAVGFVEPQIAVIVLLTSFGLAASLVPAIRANRAAPRLGMYLIYVFSLSVAASLDLSSLAGTGPALVVFVVAATFGSLALHAGLCRLARIDTDTFLVTSVAAILSPAFVPMVARGLGNPAMLMSGVAMGILGFAAGNYLGISVALLLRPGGLP